MYRLIYKSTGVNPINWDTVESIMHASEANNQRANITGALLASNCHFLQIIEGRYEDVNDLFMRIVKDQRHCNLKLIAFHPIDARLFDSWNMKGIGVFDFNKELEQELIKKYGQQSDEVRFPLEEWQVLAMIQDISLALDIPDWKQ